MSVPITPPAFLSLGGRAATKRDVNDANDGDLFERPMGSLPEDIVSVGEGDVLHTFLSVRVRS